MAHLRIRQEGSDVLLIRGGKLLVRLPWDAALVVARELHQAGKLAEEQAKAEGIVMDQAIVLRAGMPFGLSSDPRIQREAGKEAAWNSKLRRYMPGGIKSQEQVGRPAVIKHKPRRKGNGRVSETDGKEE